MLTALPGFAQEAGLTPVGVLDPPRSPTAQAIAIKAADEGISTRMVYARAVSGEVRPTAPPAPPAKSFFVPRIGNGSVWVVVLLLVAVIALWLRFGGSGTLLSRAPTDAPKPTAAPDHWRIPDADLTRAPASLLEQIAAMTDRREALIRLLRHCLLRAGQDNHTGFARSDTEREAFARLPRDWPRQQPLALILHSAELAHYGGRPVETASFAAALDAGRAILIEARHG